MIPINIAINSGAWLSCEDVLNGLYRFHIKILSFRKFNLSDVDQSEKILFYDFNSTLWLVEMEFINLTKRPIHPMFGPEQIILIDSDGYKFNPFDDFHLRVMSKFANETGMNNLFGDYLIPKIKVIGAIPFKLPNEDNAIYSISVKDGKISES